MSQDKIKFGQDEVIDNDANKLAEDIATEVEIEQAQMAAELDMQEMLLDQITQLKIALEASENKLKEQDGEVKRAYADVENMRRRTEQEIDKARKFALERFAGELLPVIDNMERAIELADQNNDALKPMLEGIELTLKTMKSTVEKFGLKELNPHGEPFNPEYHQAMSMQESAEHDPNTVMFVMQKGYELNGRVVRPAMVMVSKAPATNE